MYYIYILSHIKFFKNIDLIVIILDYNFMQILRFLETKK